MTDLMGGQVLSMIETVPAKPGYITMGSATARPSTAGTVPLVFVVNPSVQATSLSQLIALAKSKPGYITMGSAGQRLAQHLAGEINKRRRRDIPCTCRAAAARP